MPREGTTDTTTDTASPVNAAELLALAERCEKASGPDRGLDAAIAVSAKQAVRYVIDGKTPHCEPRHYTASIDDAMTLWVDRFCGQFTVFRDRAKAYIWTKYPSAVEVSAATPALALTAVALRARAQEITHERR